jgi:tripartite ATP-independent transporter DctM subunit
MKATGRAGWALFMPVLILAGIRFGLFTDTEVAAVAVIYALLVSLFVYRGLRFAELKDLIVSSGRSTGVILFLLAAAGPFSWLVAESQINRTVIDTMHSITSNPLLMLFIINVLLLLIGCLLEPLPAMVIFVPALLPLVHQLGIDPIQFGCVTVLNLMIGMMHPPIGLLLFVVSSVGRISLTPIMLEILPFFGWSLVVLLLTIFVPGVATWLPGTLH